MTVPGDNTVSGTSEARRYPDATGTAAAFVADILPASAGFVHQPKFGLSWALIAFGVFLLGLLWSATIIELREERAAEIQNAMKDTANLARAFEEHTLRTLGEADQALLFIRDMYRQQGGELDLRRLAESGLISSGIYTYFSIIDERGMLAAGSQPFTPVDLSDREHFRVHVARDTNQLFISQPVVGRASGKVSIQLSRRINKPDHSFGGVAVASVDPEYFSRFYGRLDIGARGVVTLVGRNDAIVRARRSGEKATIGQDMRNTPLFSHLQTSEHGSYRTESALDGVMRILSYRTLPNYPLVIAVGVATDEALASFNQRREEELLAAALASLLIVGFTGYLLVLVSRWQRAEKALHRQNFELAGAAETNARLATIVENSNDAIVSRTLDGTILSWNAGAERLFGYAAAEAVGRNITLLAPAERQHEPTHDSWLLQQGKTVPAFETECVAKGGRLVQVQLSVSAARDDAGNVTRVAAIFRDVTARKRAELELRDSESRFRSLTALSSDWYWKQDAEYRFVEFTRGEEDAKWDSEQRSALGLRRWELPGVMPVRGSWNEHRALLEARKPFRNFEYQRVLADGSLRYVAVSGEPVFDVGGRFAGYRGLATDITERTQADEAIARLASIVADSSDAIIGRTLEGKITSWNAAAEQLLGHTAAEAIGQPITLIMPPGHDDQTRNNSALLRRGGRIPPAEVVRQHKDGRLISVLHTLSPIRNGAGAPIGASIIIHDLSARKHAERELRHKAALAELMESLARATNEATTPEEALRACVARICTHGDWILGRVGTLALGRLQHSVRLSIWHGAQDARFAEFINVSNNFDHIQQGGTFVTAAIRENMPVWVSDFAAASSFGRRALAAKSGLRSGFVFPVFAGGKIAAFLEFFATEVREPDALFLAQIGSIGSQLARVIERQQALDAVHASQHKLESILGALHEVVWSMDPRSGRFLYLNAAAKRLARRPIIDFLTGDGRLWRRMIHSEDRVSVRAGVRQLLQDDRLTQEFRIVLTDGEVRTVENRMHVVRDTGGKLQRIDGTITDITEHKQAAERIDYLAHHDTMTGLPNRRLFNDRLTLALARDRRLGAMTAVLLLGLDRFRQINESLDHATGDKVLQTVTTRLKERLREVDTIARFGGDEFAVILGNLTDKAQALLVAEKVAEMVAEPIMIESEELFVTASVGIAVCPADADSVEQVIERAELAMYQAKDEGRNTVQAYVPVQAPRHAGLGMESKLRRALERDELLLNFQPKVNIKTGAITGAEALLRWHSPELGTISPAAFIPVAEETGLIVPIGEWVLHSACTQAAAWHRQGHPIGIAVNLSARQFRDKNLCKTVALALADSGLDARCLEFEITESMIMHRPEQTIATLHQLRDIGVKLAVDDFGTGYSSLSYLKRFPVHTLKVDQSFVHELDRNANDAAIVRAVIALAHSLNLHTIAEGVETEQQLIYLAGLHCDEYQGYYFSKPVPAAEFLHLLQGAINLTAHSAQTGVAEGVERDWDRPAPV